MRHTIFKALGLMIGLGLFAASASADPMEGTYDAGNAAGNCGDGPHGLWTNEHMGSPSCDANYFGVDGLTVELIGNDAARSGTIEGWVENPDGVSAYIDIEFSGWSDGIASGYKDGGGPYDALNQDFYSILTGTITIGDVVYSVFNMANTYLQIGLGANDKSGAFGLSTWLQVQDPDGNWLPHWDINLELVNVPEPATIALLGLGLMGIGARRRRKG